MSLVMLLVFAASGSGQRIVPQPNVDDVEARKLSLLSELQFLAADSLNLEKPLARALAQAEVADAAWTLDQTWAKKLLREAYELTLPPEEEQAKLRGRAVGSPPIFASGETRSRNRLRNHILALAGRDKAFGDELAILGAQKLGKFEEQAGYARFAEQAAKNGDLETAGDYVLRALGTDASQTEAINALNEIAKQNRAAADDLILRYLALLRNFPISNTDESNSRTRFMMGRLITPHLYDGLLPQQNVPPPGAAVVRAYVNYVIDVLSKKETADLQRGRLWLLSVWGMLKQHAPELTDAFLELEVRSRRPNEAVPLPKTTLDDVYKKKYQERMRDSLGKEGTDEQSINAALSRGDFGKARRLIDKLPDGAQKTRFVEAVNLREALSLAAQGDVAGAERLAARLNKAASMLQLYPFVIEKCIAKKDRACATSLVLQAVRQLRQDDGTPATPPDGIPAAAIATSKEADPVLMSLSKLAKLVVRLDESLALEVLGEMIAAANRSEVDTDQGRTGFDADVFKDFAARNETQAVLSAHTLKDRLRRIVSLTMIYKRKAETLARRTSNRAASLDATDAASSSAY
jgi:hypothetical protein